MKRPLFDRRSLIRLIAVLGGILLTLLILILIPLQTHRKPVPDPRYTEVRHTPAVTSEPTPEPVAPVFADPSSPDPDETLAAMLEDFSLTHEGKWDLYVFNLSRGEYASFSQFDGDPPVAASLIKLFIMACAYDQIQADQLSYHDLKYVIRNMIARSDNDCANLVIKHLGNWHPEQGFAVVNEFAESIGCHDTSLNRMMWDDNGLQNYTSAADCATLLRMLYRYELATPVYSDEMLDWLKMQTVNDRIPALLPEGTVCAHKTGDLEGLSYGDAGIVFSPRADYVFCAICNEPADGQSAINDIAGLSLTVYNYFNPDETETAPDQND